MINLHRSSGSGGSDEHLEAVSFTIKSLPIFQGSRRLNPVGRMIFGLELTHTWVEIKTRNPNIWYCAQFNNPHLELIRCSSSSDVSRKALEAVRPYYLPKPTLEDVEIDRESRTFRQNIQYLIDEQIRLRSSCLTNVTEHNINHLISTDVIGVPNLTDEVGACIQSSRRYNIDCEISSINEWMVHSPLGNDSQDDDLVRLAIWVNSQSEPPTSGSQMSDIHNWMESCNRRDYSLLFNNCQHFTRQFLNKWERQRLPLSTQFINSQITQLRERENFPEINNQLVASY